MSTELEKEGYYRKYTKRNDPNFCWRDHIKRKFGGVWFQEVEEHRAEETHKRMKN